MSSPVAPVPETSEALPTVTRDFMPYVAPMFAYVALSCLEGYLPSPGWYPAAYAVKAAVVAALMWRYRSTWQDFRPRPGAADVVLAVATGLVVLGLWIGLDGLYPDLPFMGGSRQAFDPNELGTGGKWAFIAVRMIGLALLVPVFEELFWRSFLIRFVIDQEFWKVPIGRVTWMSAGVVSALFALAHPEWLPALLTGLLWAWLLWYTRSVAACAISHFVANLALGIYVIATGEWKFW